MFGENAIAGFLQDGIRTDYIVRDKAAPSGVAMIFVAKDGENSIAVASGANGAAFSCRREKSQDRPLPEPTPL